MALYSYNEKHINRTEPTNAVPVVPFCDSGRAAATGLFGCLPFARKLPRASSCYFCFGLSNPGKQKKQNPILFFRKRVTIYYLTSRRGLQTFVGHPILLASSKLETRNRLPKTRCDLPSSMRHSRVSLQEVTIAPVPRLRCANASTLWLEWDRPKVDAVGNPPGDRVEYTLYMCGGFREWAVGDHVLVEYLSRAQRKEAASSNVTTLSVTDCDSMTQGLSPVGSSLGQFASVGLKSAGSDQNDGDGSSKNSEAEYKTPIDKTKNLNEITTENRGSVPPDAVGHSEPRMLPAIIISPSNGAGLFDIRWGDGERERGVRRNRIHRAATPSPTWEAIYQGEDCHYAVQGMLPESVLQRERGFRYEVSARFSLQTKGTEVPRDKQSRHSPVITIRTRFEGQGPRREGRWLGKGRPPGIVKARLATAKVLDSSISAAGRPTHSSLSRVGPAHGQYDTTGRGKLYL